MLNGRGVSTISTGLAAETPWAPERLLANGNISSTGFLTYGRGFLLDRDAASQMIEADRRNSMVVVPLLSGADFTETPDIRPSQYVINFGSRTEVEAAQFTLPFAWVRKYAKEERMAASRDDARKYWWRLVGRAERVYQEAARLGLSETLANLRVSKRHVFARIPRDVAPESDMNVYALASNQAFAVLQSSAHQLWANRQASSLGTTRRYTPTTCFVTFPFPKGWSGCTALEQVGREYYEFRARWMRSEGLGFTEVYNRFHDPDDRDAGVARLRSLHAALDQAVIDAYGWSDIRLEWEFLSSFAGEGRIRPIGGQEDALAVRYRWKVSFHEGVLARLLALNHACAEEERLKGVPADAAALSPSKARRLAKAKRVAEMPADGLFGGGADDGEEQ